MRYLFFLPFLLMLACTTTPTGDVAVCTHDCDDNLQSEISDSDIVRIPLGEVSEDMRKYTYQAGNTKITYFTVLGADGDVRTAFDACDVCGGRLGYSQSGQDVVCDKCGRHFSIDSIGSKNGPGGCWPSYLDHKIDGDHIVISKKDLEAGAHRFA